MSLEHANLLLNILMVVFLLIAFLWVVIHARQWRAIYQAEKLKQHDVKIDYLHQVTDRHSTQIHDIMDGAERMETRLWEELKLIAGRLDRLVCPMNNTECPLSILPVTGEVNAVGEEIWTPEQRDTFRKKLTKKERSE